MDKRPTYSGSLYKHSELTEQIDYRRVLCCLFRIGIWLSGKRLCQGAYD